MVFSPVLMSTVATMPGIIGIGLPFFVFQGVVFGLDENTVIDLVRVEFQVVGTVLHGVADGIGTNEGNFAFQTAVDGVVVGADFNQCRLACADKGDVLRTDIGFDQQFVVNRDDFA